MSTIPVKVGKKQDDQICCSGVKNGFQIFEITTDGENCIGTSVCR